MANDDAINEFAPEESGEPRSVPPAAAEPPHVSAPDVYASVSPEVDDFDELADVYASPSPEVDAGALELYAAASADVYASPTREAGTEFADEADEYALSPTVHADAYALPAIDDDSKQFPAPFESSGGVQVLAAIATVGMLAIMYAVFVYQRSSTPLSMPARVNASAQPAPEPDQLASVEPPVVDDATIAPLPSVRPRSTFDDPFGLTRGLSPSIPPEAFGARAPAAPDGPTPPAPDPPAPPSPAAAPASAAAAAPEPAPSVTPASPATTAPSATASTAASAPPPSAATPPPPVPVPSSATSASTAPGAAASASRNVATPPPASVPSVSAASPPPTAALTPAPTPAPASSPATPSPRSSVTAAAASPPAAASAIESNQSGIQNTLARYQKAFSSLNASAAREVWPTVNERSLSRAFDRLEQQNVSFDRCQIEVTNNDRAEATCNGTARYVPRVGSRTPRVDQREWRFNLVKVKDQWLIGAVDAR